MINLIIGGDLVPTKSNEEFFESGDIEKLLDKGLRETWYNSDIRLFNLEVPLVDKISPMEKWGPNLISSTSTQNGLIALKPSLITLANNHILDQGEKGLYSTVSLLEEHNIPYVGVGKDINAASKPHIIRKEGISIGVYACSENEFSVVSKHSAGGNPFDPLESLDHIQKLKSETDFVIVLYHGGKEHYRYPSPNLQKTCRKMVEKGADIVICQHSHCIGAFEKYRESTIVYGQGNFIFDYSDREHWKTSILIKLKISNKIETEFVPFIKDGNRIATPSKELSNNILNEFYRRSKEIQKEGFLNQQYTRFAEREINGYLTIVGGMNKWVSRIDRKLLGGRILKKQYNRKRLLALQNYIECEAHRELFLAGLKGKIKLGE